MKNREPFKDWFERICYLNIPIFDAVVWLIIIVLVLIDLTWGL